MMRDSRGFTLVELSVVLVIIGLIVGGIFVGRDMIKGAEVRKQIAEIEKYTAALRTFEVQYHELPGDMQYATATALGFTSHTNYASLQGNGIIEDNVGNVPIRYAYSDPYYFWIQLSQARLITGGYRYAGSTYLLGSGNQFPTLVSNEKFGILATTYTDGEVWYFLGIDGANAINQSSLASLSVGGVLTPADSYAIDKKTDDSVPSTGKVRAVRVTGGIITADTTASSCVTSAAALTYYMALNTVQCRLLIKAD